MSGRLAMRDALERHGERVQQRHKSLRRGNVVRTNPLTVDLQDFEQILVEGDDFELSQWAALYETSVGFEDGDVVVMHQEGNDWALTDVISDKRMPKGLGGGGEPGPPGPQGPQGPKGPGGPNERVPLGAAITKEAPVNPCHPQFGARGEGTGDDSEAFLAAVAYARTAGRSGGACEIYVPAGEYPISKSVNLSPEGSPAPRSTSFLGAGSEATRFRCIGPEAGIHLGRPFGEQIVDVRGTVGGFEVAGEFTARNPCRANTVNTILSDIIASFGTEETVGAYGQNCTWINLNTTDLTLDGGVGGNHFIKPELHGPGRSHIEGEAHDLIRIRESIPAVSGYPYPRGNFFHGGIAEYPGAGRVCLRQTNGSFNYFINFAFYAEGEPRALVVVSRDPDDVAYVNDSLYLVNCILQGPGALPASAGCYGLECIYLDGNGHPTTLPGALSPIILQGQTVFAGLDYAVHWGVQNPLWNEGFTRLYGQTKEWLQAGTVVPGGNVPATYSFPLGPDYVVTQYLNGWADRGGAYGGAQYRRHAGTAYLSGSIAGGALGQAAFVLPPGFRPGAYAVFNQFGAEVDVAPTGEVTPQAGGNNALVSLDGIYFKHSTTGVL